MAPQIIPAGMTTLNGALVDSKFLDEGNNIDILTLQMGNHPKLVRVFVREDRHVSPNRLRLRAMPHPNWQTWSVQRGGQFWHATFVTPAPFLHPTASLADIYLEALDVLHYPVSDATRLQINNLGDNQILDLPLEGDAVFHDDYSWFSTVYKPNAKRTYVYDPDEDNDDLDKSDGGSSGFEGDKKNTNQGDDTKNIPEDEADKDESCRSKDEQGSKGDKHSSEQRDHRNIHSCDDTSTTVAESSDGSHSSDDPFYLDRRYANIMPPSGPKAQHAVATNNSTPAPTTEPQAPKGPHPGHIQVACQYTSEQRLRRMLRDNKSDPAREDSYRLQGVQLIDNVRNVLHVPVKTFDTACVYYHWFRLSFRDAEYNYQDAAMASLFLACKVEDTIKKSKEILCAAYNIKNPDHPTTQDDKMFEQPSKIIIGLERLILETVGFDFRCRYPQSALLKATKRIMGGDAKHLFATAMDMSIDLYKTFAPIKQPTFAMALGLLELSSRLTGTGVEKIEKVNLLDYHTTRQSVVETMLDLLDLYTQHLKSTKLGNRFDLNKFIEVKIIINNEVDNDPKLMRHAHWCNNCDGGEDENLSNGTSVLKNISFFGSNSAKRNGRSQEGTMRFVFDPEQARCERREVESYYKDEYEEYEVEVEVPLEPERQNHHHHNNNNNNHRDNKRHDGGGWGGGRRNHHHDRRKGGGHRGYY